MPYPIGLERWVSEHTPKEECPHRASFIEAMELFRYWHKSLGSDSVTVVGELSVRTPPPYQILILPLVRFDLNPYEVDVAYDFSQPSFEPKVLVGCCSVKCRGQTASAMTTGPCSPVSLSERARELYETLPILRDPEGFDAYDDLLARALVHFGVKLSMKGDGLEGSHLNSKGPGVRFMALNANDALAVIRDGLGLGV